MYMSDDDSNDDSTTYVYTNPTKNPYNNGMRDRMIKYASDIKFIKDRYIAPVTVELSSPLKSREDIIHITATHCKIFVAMKLLDSTVKLITQDDKVFEHPTYLYTDNEYKIISRVQQKTLIYSNQKIFS